MSNYSAEYWIEKFNLHPHPEGGFFREVYRSEEKIKQDGLPSRFGGGRNFATSIYFLMPAGKFSALHRIASDEGWHFYTGSTLAVYTISPEGELATIQLGANPEQGDVFQAVVPHGYWFGAKLQAGEGYALVGCTVAPGFDFADFEMAKRDNLIKQFPQHSEVITMLTYS
jgi:predicted cupin superfamily sugar epimerase